MVQGAQGEKTCPKCGGSNRASARFCTHCGARFAPHETEAVPASTPSAPPGITQEGQQRTAATVRCSNCGTENAASARSCKRCYATLGRQATPTGSQSEQAAALPSNAATTGVACPRCGTENAPSARSCKRCLANLNQQGQAISPVPEAKRAVAPGQPATAGVACPRCGTENSPSARSCKRCLATLPSLSAGVPAASASLAQPPAPIEAASSSEEETADAGAASAVVNESAAAELPAAPRDVAARVDEVVASGASVPVEESLEPPLDDPNFWRVAVEAQSATALASATAPEEPRARCTNCGAPLAQAEVNLGVTLCTQCTREQAHQRERDRRL